VLGLKFLRRQEPNPELEPEPGNVGLRPEFQPKFQPEFQPEFSSLRPEFQPGFENF
jgi:hypothetical protein